ncbi:MAG: hypothetical protein ACK4WF_03590 [Candidatus Brocadiales bacterium]
MSIFRTRIYFLFYYLAKSYLIKTKIYPMKFPLKDFIRNVWHSLSLEGFKHLKERDYQEKHRSVSAGVGK